MSKMHHSDFVAILAHIYEPKVYLELGLYTGETFQKVKRAISGIGSRCIGVDIKKPPIDGEIYVQTTDEFFENFNESVDMIFIDADHSYESVVRDLENCLKILNKTGCIILHDTDPDNDSLFVPTRCGDSYKIVDELEKNPNLNVTTLPISEAGLSVVTWKNSTRTQMRRENSTIKQEP
jgi:hypothetical protein